MTKQDLLDMRWRVYLNYGGSVPLPDHLGDFMTQLQSDISSVTDAQNLPVPDQTELLARIYHVSASLPASPRQNIVIGWKDLAPYFSCTTEVA